MTKETSENKEQVIEGIPFEHYKRKGGGVSSFGLIIIFLGTLFLLNNLGIVPWDVWNGLWRFWPVLVIFIGLRMLIGRNWLSRLIFSLFTLFVFAGILAYILYYYGVLRIAGFPNF